MERKNKSFLGLLLSLLMMSVPMVAQGAIQRGDVNGDGEVTISDVTELMNGLLTGSVSEDDDVADVNADGSVGIADVTALIQYLLLGGELPPLGPQIEEFVVNGVPFAMVPVEGGTFTMGATAEQGSDPSDRERPAHQVTVSAFSIGQTEVTQALWQAVMSSAPSYFTGYDLPVERVSWEDCQVFISLLRQLTGRNFRLPTEAEWEFAARGGNKSLGYKYAGSNNLVLVAWYSYNASWELRGTGNHGTHPVATREPNELELFDMSGNVHEWCEDWYGDYSSEAQVDPTGPATGSGRVYRGGTWYFDEWFCRVSFRNSVSPTYRSYGIGLRLAL